MRWNRETRPGDAQRWERILAAERSLGHQLAGLAARVPWLRRALRLPGSFGAATDHSVGAREARVEQVESSLLGRARVRAVDEREAAHPEVEQQRPRDFPRIGPRLDREIDAALELLRAVPFEDLQRRGWHLQPNHPDWPLNDVPFLRAHPEVWLGQKVPAEVNWDFHGQLELLERLGAFAGELDDVPDGPAARPGEYSWGNSTFPRDDALAYYGVVRHLQPRHVIEVGAGWSSLVLAKAVSANGAPCDVTLIEPSPNHSVLGELADRWDLVEDLVQFVDLSVFDKLEAGDVLFYDGSHCVRAASDVNWMFFEVLPRLPAGVWIHVHDMFWPGDYPPSWVLDEAITWNEQYLVQAFLIGNTDYRVRLAIRMINEMRGPDVASAFPADGSGGSLWIEKVAL